MASDVLQTGFYFSLRLTGSSATSDAAFQEVSGLSREIGIEEVVSGGENRFKYRLPATGSFPNLVLKRGIVLTNSPLAKWCQTTMEGGLAKPIQTKDVMLSLLDSSGKTTMSWSFSKAWPVKWNISDLKSQENNVLIETIELAYQYFQIGGRTT